MEIDEPLASKMTASELEYYELPPSKRPRRTPKEIMARLTVNGIKNFLAESNDFFQLKQWQHIDYLLFAGIYIDNDGKVMVERQREINLGERQPVKVLNDASTYMPVLRKLKSIYPHLKIVWCLPGLLGGGNELGSILEKSSDNFWQSLATISTEQLAGVCDGIELNMELVCTYPDRFIADVEAFPLRHKLICTINNRVEVLRQTNLPLSRLSQLIHRIIVNSFGYMKFERETSAEGREITHLLNAYESGISDYEETLKRICEKYKVELDNFIMGIDTSGVLYVCNDIESWTSGRVGKISLIPYKDIHLIRTVGEIHDSQLLRYIEVYSDKKKGSVLEMCDQFRKISYDSQSVREAKFDLVKEEGMAGVAIGDIYYDLKFEHKHSVLAVAHENLADKSSLSVDVVV